MVVYPISLYRAWAPDSASLRPSRYPARRAEAWGRHSFCIDLLLKMKRECIERGLGLGCSRDEGLSNINSVIDGLYQYRGGL